MMIKNCDQSVNINHNPDWPYIPDHPYKIFITCDAITGTGQDLNDTKLNKTSMTRY